MANLDDPNAVMDGLTFFDEDEPNPPRRTTPMIKAKLELDKLTDDGLTTDAGTIATKMTANAGTFPLSAATVAILVTRLATYSTAKANVAAGKLTQQGLVDAKDAARADVEASLRTLGGQADDVAKGDIGIIHDAGMKGSSEGGPLTMVQVTEMSVTSGQHDGEIDWMCHRQTGAIFITETSPDVTPRVWTHRSAGKASSGTIGGLPSLTKVWVRTSAQGSNNTGGWSDPAQGNVP